MENKTYHEQKNIEYTKKLREFLAVLPPYATTYFRGIEQKTAPRTRLAYANDIRIFFEWLHNSNPLYKEVQIKNIPIEALDDLQPFDIEEYMEYLKLYSSDNDFEVSNSETAIKRKMSALRSFYNYFYKNQSIKNNPAVKVDMPKLHEKAIIRLDADETAKLLDNVEEGFNMSKKQKMYHDKNKTRDLALITLLLGTGIRVTECVGLNLSDVDLKNDRIKVTRKGGYEAYVYFGDEVRAALLSYLEERNNIKDTVSGHEDALFLSTRKTRISVRNVEVTVKKYAQSVTTLKKITPHKLRSTYGTALYRETGDIYLVADVLGHKDVNTTKKHYAAIEEDRRRKAKDIVRLRED